MSQQFDELADIQAAIEAAGGDVVSHESEAVENGGIAAALAGMMGGEAPTHQHHHLEVCITGPTTRDIPDPDSALDGDDVMTCIAIAHAWAKDEELDQLADDLNDIGSRIGQQMTGQAHAIDEMEQFDIAFDGGDD